MSQILVPAWSRDSKHMILSSTEVARWNCAIVRATPSLTFVFLHLSMSLSTLLEGGRARLGVPICRKDKRMAAWRSLCHLILLLLGGVFLRRYFAFSSLVPNSSFYSASKDFHQPKARPQTPASYWQRADCCSEDSLPMGQWLGSP